MSNSGAGRYIRDPQDSDSICVDRALYALLMKGLAGDSEAARLARMQLFALAPLTWDEGLGADEGPEVTGHE